VTKVEQAAPTTGGTTPGTAGLASASAPAPTVGSAAGSSGSPAVTTVHGALAARVKHVTLRSTRIANVGVNCKRQGVIVGGSITPWGSSFAAR
jgi:hypothetical protein